MKDDLSEIAAHVKMAYDVKELRLLDRHVVERAGIETVDAEFLCNVGVPCIEQLQISFNLSNELPSLHQYIERKMAYSPKWPIDYLCLNDKYKIIIGIDKGRDGNVMCLDLTGKLPMRFVNSRVRHLIGFMAECVLHWKRWTQDGIVKEQSYQAALNWMRSIDDKALEPETWWRTVFEQMEIGL